MKTRHEEMRQQVKAYHTKHPEVWELFCEFAFQMISKGYKHDSAKAVFERIRWEKDAGGDGVTQFKVGNNHPAFYARAFMKKYPQHNGFFRLREQTSHKKPANHLDEYVPNLTMELKKLTVIK